MASLFALWEKVFKAAQILQFASEAHRMVVEKIETFILVEKRKLIGYRFCGKCREYKYVTDWNRSRLNIHGLQHWCRECHAQIRNIWARKNKHRRLEILKRYHRTTYYGLTESQRLSMYNEQEGKCAICKAGIELDNLHTDHNHKTKVVRGFLCGFCNRGLGQFKDNIEALRAAIKYLEEAKKNENGS